MSNAQVLTCATMTRISTVPSEVLKPTGVQIRTCGVPEFWSPPDLKSAPAKPIDKVPVQAGFEFDQRHFFSSADKWESHMIARVRKSLDEKEKGFTLIELLVVIIIIGILAAIAIPVFLNQRQKGWDAAIKSDLKNMATAEETVLTDTGLYLKADTAASLVTLKAAGFKPSAASNYDTTATAITGTFTTGTVYCLTAKSASGKFWTYKSDLGGLQPDSGAVAGC